MSKLHPTTSLYEDVTDEVKVEEYFNFFKNNNLLKLNLIISKNY